jgi:hypothetical protein
MRRFTTILIVVLMMAFSISLHARKTFGEAPEGDGSPGSPFKIATLKNLVWLSESPDIWEEDYSFLQTADICFWDMMFDDDGYWDGFVWTPIGVDLYEIDDLDRANRTTRIKPERGTRFDKSARSSRFFGDVAIPFVGHYDGGGYKISNLEIVPIDEYYYEGEHYISGSHGLFGLAELAVIENLVLEFVSINGTFGNPFLDALESLGTLIGFSNYVEIDNVKVDFLWNGMEINSSIHVGGLVGIAFDTWINNSYTRGNKQITFSDLAGGYIDVGGLVGWGYDLYVDQCFSTMDITAEYTDPLAAFGGLIADMWDGELTNSFFNGMLRGMGESGAGLVAYIDAGIGAVKDCFVSGQCWLESKFPTGSFAIAIAANNGSVVNTYWDSQTTGLTIGFGEGVNPSAAGKWTSELKFDTMTFIGWDFANVWEFHADYNFGYPNLINNPYHTGSGGGDDLFFNYEIFSYLSGYDVELYWEEWGIGTRFLNYFVPVGFNIYRTELDANMEMIGESRVKLNSTQLSLETEKFTDSPGSADANYLYELVGIDEFGDESDPANTFAFIRTKTAPWNTRFEEDVLQYEFSTFLAGWTRFEAVLDEPTTGFKTSFMGWNVEHEYDNNWNPAPPYSISVLFSEMEYFWGDNFAYWKVSPSIAIEKETQYYVYIEAALSSWDEFTPSVDTRFAIVISTDNGITWNESDVIKEWVGDELLELYDAEEGTPSFVKVPFMSGAEETIKIGFYVEQLTGDSMYSLIITNVAITTEVSETETTIPVMSNTLFANYPNPFNPTTNISFFIEADSPVTIDVFNIRGQRVKTLTNEMFTAGRHNVVWNGTDTNGRNVGSGVYFYRMKSEGFAETKKMLLLK